MKYVRILFSALSLILFSTTLSHADGLLQNKQTKQFLRLSKTLIDVQVIDQIAVTTMTHEFINPEDVDSLDVIYMFPLPENAAVTGIAVWRDSSFVDFELTKADTGGGNQTLPPGNSDPGLMNYLLPNPFILPTVATADTFRVRLSYAELLPFDFGAIQYRFPLYSDRYSAGRLDAFAILLTFSTHRTIADIQTPGFPSGIELSGPYSARVGFDQANYTPNVNFIVDYQLAQDEVGLFTLPYRDPADTTKSAGFFVALLEPGVADQEDILNKHFIFVLDRSGSMGGTKIVQARDAAQFSVEHLNENDFFNIVDFSSNTKLFRNEAVQATPQNIADAVGYIHGIRAVGGTNINEALLTALSQTIPNEINQLIFLTDGQPTVGVTAKEEILDNVRKANMNDASIFVFGVGFDAGKDLLQSLADQNHGVATYLDPDEPIDTIIGNFFSRVNNPVLANVHLDFGTLNTFDVFPIELPDMFAGFQQIIVGRYTEPAMSDITLHGTVANADTSIIYPKVTFPDSNTVNSFVPKIWAKKKIDYLYARWLTEGEPDELKDDIISLSTDYGVLSPFTEFSPPVGNPTAVEEILTIAAQVGIDVQDGLPSIKLSWHFSGPVDGIVSVDIFRKAGNSGDFVRIATLSPDRTTFTDTDANPADRYRYRFEAKMLDGGTFSQTLDYQPQLAKTFTLAQNYPNPFNPTTKIRFFVGNSSQVILVIFNLKGERIATPVNNVLTAGEHAVEWDGKDERGRQVASGVYFYQLNADDFKQTRKMILAR